MSRSISSRQCARCEKVKENSRFYRGDELCMICRNSVNRNSQDTRKRKCSQCQEAKFVHEFSDHQTNGRNVIQSVCRECRSIRAAKYSQNYLKRDPLARRNMHLIWKYGITLAEYNAMLEEQKGLCACCGQPERNVHFGRVKTLVVDHCHVTDAVRGLLCDACNTTIGLMREDPDRVMMLFKYIEDRCLW